MDIVSEAARRFGNAPALFTPDGTTSFIECDQQSACIASTLAAKGIGEGEIVAIVAPNSPAMLLLLMALLRIGAIAAPVNHRFPASHIEGVLHRLGPKLTLVDPAVCAGLSGMQTMTLQKLIDEATGSPSEDFRAASAVDRPASIIHTSASSGAPKAVLHSFSNHWHNAMGSATNIAFAPGECWLLSLPLYHIGGYSMLFKSLVGGGALATGFEQNSLEESLARLPVTHLSLVPTQLYRMLRSPESTSLLKRLKVILLGGSASSMPLLEEAVHAELPVYLTYGSTEMGSQITTSTRPVTKPTKESGRVLPYREVMIAPDGEILVKGACLFVGYLSEGTLRKARDSEGWFHTGDTGSISEEGQLYVLGRKDNMFISGGENIHPEEIEQALAAIPGITEALVVPSPDSEYGMRPAAWLRTEKGAWVEESVIADMLRKSIGRLKTPVAFSRVEKWVTIAGSAKIDRNWYRRLASGEAHANGNS